MPGDKGQDLITVEDAYRILGIENMRAYFDGTKCALILELRLDRPSGESATGKSVVFAGTRGGPVKIQRFDSRVPPHLRDFKLSVSVYREKNKAILGARQRKNKELRESDLLSDNERE